MALCNEEDEWSRGSARKVRQDIGGYSPSSVVIWIDDAIAWIGDGVTWIDDAEALI